MLGGVVGGVVTYIGFGSVMYLRAYIDPLPNQVDYIGPELVFLILASLGALIGLLAGFLVWAATSVRCLWGKPEAQ
jgi:hypothetical protein